MLIDTEVVTFAGLDPTKTEVLQYAHLVLGVVYCVLPPFCPWEYDAWPGVSKNELRPSRTSKKLVLCIRALISNTISENSHTTYCYASCCRPGTKRTGPDPTKIHGSISFIRHCEPQHCHKIRSWCSFDPNMMDPLVIFAVDGEGSIIPLHLLVTKSRKCFVSLELSQKIPRPSRHRQNKHEPIPLVQKFVLSSGKQLMTMNVIS